MGSSTVMTFSARWRGGTRDSVQLYWDAVGRRDSVIYSNGAKVKLAYEKDGAVRLVCGTHTGGPFGDVFNFTQHHIWIDPEGLIRETRGQAIASCGAIPSPQTVKNSYDTRHQLTQQIAGIDTNTYRYDVSGNRTLWRWARGSVVVRHDSNYTDPYHNRLARTRVVGDPPGLQKAFSYDSTGARLVEQWYLNGLPTNGPGKRFYFYDGLSRPTGTEEFQCTEWDVNGNCSNWSSVPSPTACSYDPVGRIYSPCENLSPLLGFDGDNVVRTGNDSIVSATWTFVHGPGTDDPLMAHFTSVSPGYTAYIVTDGSGGQFAVGDPDGYDCSGGIQTNCGLNYLNNGGKYSGGVRNAQSFGAERHGSSSVYKMSFFRNRFYDQQTGRWTQEDPIGLAGGLNLYNYAANNPAMFTDPFGLCPVESGGDGKTQKKSDCPPGTQGFRDYLFSMGTVDNARALQERKFLAPTMANPTGGRVRGCDVWGCGSFGSTRDGGRRRHAGVDYVIRAGGRVYAAMTGTVTRYIGSVYANSSHYNYIEISSGDWVVRMLYVDPSNGIGVGTTVNAGSIIGHQQPLYERYPGITEHVEVQLRFKGVLVDPTSLIPVP